MGWFLYVILPIVLLFLTVWDALRRTNAEFYDDELNELDKEIFDASESMGSIFKSMKLGMRDGKNFFKKHFH